MVKWHGHQSGWHSMSMSIIAPNDANDPCILRIVCKMSAKKIWLWQQWLQKWPFLLFDCTRLCNCGSGCVRSPRGARSHSGAPQERRNTVKMRGKHVTWSQKLDDGKKLHSTAQNSCFCQPTHCHRVLWVLFSVKNWGWNWGLNLVCLKQQSVHVCHDKHNAAHPNFWHTCFVLHMTMWMSTFSWHSMSESVGVQCKQLKLAGGFCVFHTK